MHLCDQCPDNPSCSLCTGQLPAGETACKVIPPRRIRLMNLLSETSYAGELVAVSRQAIGVIPAEAFPPGRYEVEVDSDCRILASTVADKQERCFVVMEIEKVLCREEAFERLMLHPFYRWRLTDELEAAVVFAAPDEREARERERIRREVDNLPVLQQIRDVRIFLWQKGRLCPLGDFALEDEFRRQLDPLITRAISAFQPVREQWVSDSREKVMDVHVLPLSGGDCGIAMIDVSQAIAAERSRKWHEWNCYKNLLSIVTKGRLMLLPDDELYLLIRSHERMLTQPIRQPADFARLRQSLRDVLSPFGISKRRLTHFLVAVSEAATNALTHGCDGNADVYLSREERICRVLLCDKGAGIRLSQLPQAMLVNGYSTRDSLGAGFHLMMAYADKIFLNSSPDGTKIVLELTFREDQV